MIGLLTAIVGDLAGIFGCLVGLRDSVTGEDTIRFLFCDVGFFERRGKIFSPKNGRFWLKLLLGN
jgi:hypothetical protein